MNNYNANTLIENKKYILKSSQNRIILSQAMLIYRAFFWTSMYLMLLIPNKTLPFIKKFENSPSIIFLVFWTRDVLSDFLIVLKINLNRFCRIIISYFYDYLHAVSVQLETVWWNWQRFNRLTYMIIKGYKFQLWIKLR